MQAPPAAAACLQASLLFRRRIRSYRDLRIEDEQALLAVCTLLDALARGLASSSTAAGPGDVERAALRLAEQLNRADTTRMHPGRPPVGTLP